MRSAFLPVLLLVGLGGRAQDVSLLPGLSQELEAASNDTLRADALARICFNLIRSDPDSARLVGDQALALAKKIQNPRALGDAHNNLGWLAAEQGQFARADSLLNIALGIFQKLGKPAYTSVTLSNLGWLAEKQGDSVGSLKFFQEALRESEAAQDSASTAILLYSIGVTYRKMKEFPKALEHLDRSMVLERSLHRKGKEANCMVGVANTLREMGDTLAAVGHLEKATELYAAVGDHQGAGIVEENLGELWRPRRPLLALAHFARALAHYDTLGSAIDRAYALMGVGMTHLALKQLDKAGAALEEGATLAGNAGAPELSMEYAEALAELSSQRGDAKGTYTHFQRYLALKDSLQGADTQRELARLRTEFDAERKEKDNAILRAENSEQDERIHRGEIQLYGSIVLGGLALVAALLFFRNYRQKRRHAEVLEDLNQQLANSNAEITEINGLLEMKLLRSQMNPHFIYNCLNSAAQMTQAGKQAEALAYLQAFARLLRMVLDQSVNDRVTIQEEMDFLQQYLKLESVRLEGLRYELHADEVLLDDEAELPALLVQPFVENAIWHGLSEKKDDRSISVSFRSNGHGFTCTIEDNGLGRDHAAQVGKQDPEHRSLGMQLTSERLRLLSRRMMEHGDILVEDLQDEGARPSGTRVTLTLG